MHNERTGALAELALHANDGLDYFHVIEVLRGSEYSFDRVRLLFQGLGVPWGKPVEHDVNRILSDRPPRYFLSADEWASRYRAERGIDEAEPDDEEPDSLLHTPDDLADLLLSELSKIRQDVQKHVVSGFSFRQGYACLHEQQYFYGTQEWQDKAKALRFIAGYQCEQCKARNRPLHVHHVHPIFTMYSWRFYLNFTDWKLQVLCEACHRAFHSRTVRGIMHYVPASPDEVREEKQTFRKLGRMHDDLDECLFCEDRIAERYPNG